VRVVACHAGWERRLVLRWGVDGERDKLDGFFGGEVRDEWAFMRDCTMSVHDILRRHLPKIHDGGIGSD